MLVNTSLVDVFLMCKTFMKVNIKLNDYFFNVYTVDSLFYAIAAGL